MERRGHLSGVRLTRFLISLIAQNSDSIEIGIQLRAFALVGLQQLRRTLLSCGELGFDRC